MKNDTKDLGFLDDAIFCLSHAVALENHAINSYNQTKKKSWLDVAKMVREDRSKILYSIVKENNGEGYCATKHCLAIAVSLKELGNRMVEEKNMEYALELFEMSKNYEALVKFINDKEAK